MSTEMGDVTYCSGVWFGVWFAIVMIFVGTYEASSSLVRRRR